MIRKLSILIMACVLALTVAGCVKVNEVSGSKEVKEEVESTETETEEAGEPGEETISGTIETLERGRLLPDTYDESELADIKPHVSAYTIDEDLGNIINREDFGFNDGDWKDKLVKNGFVVSDGAGREFFELYEDNRYLQRPNFVTVDSMMHTYHIYFAYLMRDIEKNHLYDDLSSLTADMLDKSYAQYKELKGTEWEKAAERNVAFFSVAATLLDDSAKFPASVKDTVNAEHELVMEAGGIDTSPLTGDYEDYSQYKPRGYYEGDTTLEKYFRTMMWYGRRQFSHDSEDMDRSALLMTLAIDDGEFDTWNTIYEVTSFFAGASDDLGYCEYKPVIDEVYGDGAGVSSLVGDEDNWKKFHEMTANLRAPRINSIPIDDSEDSNNVIPGYRFMGQRFTIDATIMQELTYSRVGEYEDEDKRMLPDFLDVPAALGSDMAYSILEDTKQTGYKNFDKNLKSMKDEFINDDCTIWNASLYASWLNTLRPLLTPKTEGYPMFMQNDEWTKKDLETFAGSFTELKHDTILYSKQMMAEMGGGWEEDKDYRGYVEPEPLVYLRFESLARDTAEGLKKLGYLSDADEENLNRLADLADKLKTISIKELQEEKLTDKEYELIEIYGGEIEHFWFDAMKGQTGDSEITTGKYPAALVVDVATDPNGDVLEMATGDPAVVYVVVPVEGKLRIAEGVVYSFYQFTVPISERMTDSEWRKAMGIEIEDYENWSPEKPYDHPEWARSYRYYYKYE